MNRIVIFLVIAIIASCSPQISVFSDYDPDYDLWTYKTFDWGQKVHIEEGKNPFHYNELNDKRIKAAVQEQMIVRGYQLADEAPDLILHYHIIVNDRSIVTTEPYGYNYGPYWMKMHTNIYSYREGTLILDLMDTKTQNLMWRGWAVVEVDQIDPEEVNHLIKTTIARIFRKYPKAPANFKNKKQAVSN